FRELVVRAKGPRRGASAAPSTLRGKQVGRVVDFCSGRSGKELSAARRGHDLKFSALMRLGSFNYVHGQEANRAILATLGDVTVAEKNGRGGSHVEVAPV